MSPVTLWRIPVPIWWMREVPSIWLWTRGPQCEWGWFYNHLVIIKVPTVTSLPWLPAPSVPTQNRRKGTLGPPISPLGWSHLLVAGARPGSLDDGSQVARARFLLPSCPNRCVSSWPSATPGLRCLHCKIKGLTWSSRRCHLQLDKCIYCEIITQVSLPYSRHHTELHILFPDHENISDLLSQELFNVK